MRTSLPRLVLLVIFMAYAHAASSQLQTRHMKPRGGTVCYLDTRSASTFVPAPEDYKKWKAGARTKTTSIEVTYDGFTPEAELAFEAAVNIWETLITTDITIHVLARWRPLDEGILGGAGPGEYLINFDGAQRNNLWYPVSLAEKMARKDLNEPGEPDIVATFNSDNPNWHFGLDGDLPSTGKYDFMSVVLHEIGHGLGITNSYEVNGTTGSISFFFDNQPVVYEVGLETLDNKSLIEFFDAPSNELGSQIVSEELFYDSPLVLEANSNSRASIYAPAEFDGGSSISHLDEATYPAGSANSLMTPNLGAAERVLDPGPIITAILTEMGWRTTFIEHTKVPSTETVLSTYDVVCKVTSDTGFDAASLSVNYSTNGTTFTVLPMTPTGNTDEFKASIPTGHSNYEYFIKVTDDDSRTITNPGTAYHQGGPTTQSVFSFEVGPDNTAPIITHIPVVFIAPDEALAIEAVITDNIGIEDVKLEWMIKGVAQPDQSLVLVQGPDSVYFIGITFPEGTLNIGDKIQYRIRATDASIAGNVTAVPSATEFFEVDVTGLVAAQDAYFSDFNSLSDSDFFGSGFSLSTPAGFADGAIHSLHPYPEAGEDEELNFIYNLKIPIIIREDDAFIRFDEIVLVEPGEPGAEFGSDDFFDYVVVEGSKDQGVTWVSIADGYDSRDKNEWLAPFISSMSGNNSTAIGNPSLYRPRSIDLLATFELNDIVAIRFRLFSDPLSAGWGWAIDNLKIQLDSQPPKISHQHVDYIMDGATQLELEAIITDAFGLDKIFVEHKINDGSIISSELVVDPAEDLYAYSLSFEALNAGDVLSYRIRAIDGAEHITVYPNDGFIKVVELSLASPVDEFATDFSTTSPDISGNFFATATVDGFQNGAIHSMHPYPADPVASTYSWYVTKPIKVDEANPNISFDEIVITQYNGSGPVDYLVMEASKDGLVWETLVDKHAANFDATWKSTYDNEGPGASPMYVRREVSITEGGHFNAGDVILVRFRFFSDPTETGWGFAVDNLNIQGPITGVEDHNPSLSVYPNPVSGDEIFMSLSTSSDVVFTNFVSAQGQVFSEARHSSKMGSLETSIHVGDLPAGLYILRVETAEGVSMKKIVRTR